MAAPLDAFSWKKKPLELEVTEWDNCKNDEEYTAILVDSLRQSEYAPVAKILDENREIQRLFHPKTYFSQGKEVWAEPKLDRQTRATAIASFIFEKTELKKPTCKQCDSFQARGPASTCCVAISKWGGGACTNCYYSGQGKVCSFRVEAKNQEAEKSARKEKKEFDMYTAEQLQRVPEDTLLEWQQMVKDEMNKRRAGKTPVKKRRI